MSDLRLAGSERRPTQEVRYYATFKSAHNATAPVEVETVCLLLLLRNVFASSQAFRHEAWLEMHRP